MSLESDDVRRIAILARINVPAEELEPLAEEMNGIIGWIEQLSEVDTEGVEPMTSVTEMIMKQREDKISDAGYAERVVKNAPDRINDFFTVPKVIE